MYHRPIFRFSLNVLSHSTRLELPSALDAPLSIVSLLIRK